MVIMIMPCEEGLLTGPTCLEQEGLHREAGGTVASIRNPECFGFHCALADSQQSLELLLYIVAILWVIGPEAGSGIQQNPLGAAGVAPWTAVERLLVHQLLMLWDALLSGWKLGQPLLLDERVAH